MMIEFQHREMRDMNARLKQENERIASEIKDLKAEYAHEKEQTEIAHID